MLPDEHGAQSVLQGARGGVPKGRIQWAFCGVTPPVVVRSWSFSDERERGAGFGGCRARETPWKYGRVMNVHFVCGRLLCGPLVGRGQN